MARRPSPRRFRLPQALHRRTLLAGVSAFTLLAAGTPAQARNILAPGAGSAAAASAAAGAILSAQQAAAATQQSMNSLTRATQAIQAMQAAQGAAHNLALSAPSTVPDGLATGGLVPDSGLAASGVANPVTTWVGANTPTQTTSGTQTLVTVQQTQQKAIVTWSSFNVGRNTTLYFDQSGGNPQDVNDINNWVVLNRVSDPSAQPSQILGSIKAEGAVYVLDANGIIFGGSSQVNVQTLIASSLNLFSNTFGNPTAPASGTTAYRFLNGGIGDLTTLNYSTSAILLTTTNPNAGAITVEPGAAITGGAQGLVLLAAPSVTNHGSISAAGGQVALIGGIGVSYDYNDTSFNSGSDGNTTGTGSTGQGTNDNSTTNLRFASYGKLTDANGNDITPIGSVLNDGIIEADRGNITLVAGTIAQNGVLATTTSVTRPGSIVLTSLYEVGDSATINSVLTPLPADESSATFYATARTGSITFGPNSVTTILPDADPTTSPSDPTSLAKFANTAGAALFTSPLPTQGFGTVMVIGQAVDVQGGSLLYAPGQSIRMNTVVMADPRNPVPGSGRILVESGAVLDVSGYPDVVEPADANLLTVILAGNELADSPLQQNTWLYGQTITVDMRVSGTNAETGESWVGTPLANLTSYESLVQQSIEQLMVNGGALLLTGSEVVAETGSVMNVQGGYIHYLAGTLNTTRLLGSDGHIYDVGSANPNITYVGFAGQFTVDHAHWGVTQTYNAPLIAGGTYSPDYVQGGNGGTLSIEVYDNSTSSSNGVAEMGPLAGAGGLIIDSTLLAQTVAGQRQVASASLPIDGTLSILGIMPIEIADASAPTAAAAAAMSVPTGFGMASPMLDSSSGGAYAANVIGDATLDAADFSGITLNNEVTHSTTASTWPKQNLWFSLDAGASLVVQPGGSIGITADGATINGTLTARSGLITVLTNPLSTAAVSDLVVGSGAVLDVSGLFLNEALTPTNAQGGSTNLVNGGTIVLETHADYTNGSTHSPAVADSDLTGNLTLAAGSLLNLDSGGRVSANGTLQTNSAGVPVGSGGTLFLEPYGGTLSTSGNDGNYTVSVGNGFTVPVTSSGAPPTRGKLTLAGTIEALGFSGGGTLNLNAAAIQVGGDPASTPSYANYFDPTLWGQRGFASFVLSSGEATWIPDGAVVRLTHSNLLPNANTIATAPTGADPRLYSTVGTLTGTQLTATNLTINAGMDESDNYLEEAQVMSAGGEYAELGRGAEILADPGASITISSEVMTEILGSIIDHGGTISLAVSYPTPGNGAPSAGPLYIGPQSLLDVSGTTVVNPAPALLRTASGALVTPYTGNLLAGGTVSLDDQWTPILVAPGAVINVSGAADTFQVQQAAPGGILGGSRAIMGPQAVWSDAGTVSLESYAGLLFEGTLIGQGGAPEANGGTLKITGDVGASGSGTASTIYLVQDTTAALAASAALNKTTPFNLATYAPALTPGAVGTGIDATVPLGTLLFGANSLGGSGFANVALSDSSGTIDFSGRVSLTLPGTYSSTAFQYSASNLGNFSGTLTTANGIPTTNGASLSVTAGYIAFGGGSGGAGAGGTSDAQMTLSANALDIISNIDLSAIGQATFISNTTLRFMPSGAGNFNGPATTTATAMSATMASGGSLTFEAAEIYPTTSLTYTITTPQTVTFGYPAGVGPSTITPLSAGAALVVDAGQIYQNGEIWVPFGAITLGLGAATSTLTVATTEVVLGSGSITSVAADGAVIPYGTTTDQTTWTYDPRVNVATWNNANISTWSSTSTTTAQALTAAPQGMVTLSSSQSVTVNSGAVVDLRGGGDLQAQEWIPGTGGSRDVLSQTNIDYTKLNPNTGALGAQVPLYPDGRQIYAIVPTYGASVAAYDPVLTQSGLSAGQAVYLSGGGGLAAGTYLLLPAKYATLPGAYRVVVNSGVTNPLVSSYTLPDGTIEMSGSFANLLTGTRSSSVLQFYVQSGPVWKQYSDYALTSANSFFPSYAATNNFAQPYIPIDAGHLVLAPGTALTLNGTLLSSPADGGYGAQVDITASQKTIEITSGTPTPDGNLQIDASMLTDFGAVSLLIGGTRSQTTGGTLITPTAANIIIDNPGEPLEAPEIILVAKPSLTKNSSLHTDQQNDGYATVYSLVADTGQVTIQPNSVVEATGTVGSGEQTTLILGASLAALGTLPTSYEGGYETYGAGRAATAITQYYATLSAALGTVVRLSTGDTATVEMPTYAELNPAAITVTDPGYATLTLTLPSLSGGTGLVVGSGAQLLGGNALLIASTGTGTVNAGAVLAANNITAKLGDITFVGAGGSAPSNGSAISTAVQLLAADSIDLQSTGVIHFSGNVALDMTSANGSLTLSAGALQSDDGGSVSITAPTLVLANELGATEPSFSAGSGTLAIDAGTLVFGTGDKTLVGFGSISVTAHQGVLGQGTGSMNFGSLPLTLETPIVVADTGSSQTISTTSADINLLPLPGGTPMTSTALGGAITFETQQSGSITVSVPIQALAGNISLLTGTNGGTASGGNVTVTGTGQLIAHGVAQNFYYATEYASAGEITLSATGGTVVLAPGSVADFSGAPGGGDGGILSITATGTVPVTLNGTLLGATAQGYTGSSFSLTTGGAVALDTLATILTNAGVTGSISVETADAGGLSLSRTLTAHSVALVADNGSVTVSGTINAAGISGAVDAADAAGGTIELFGTSGVTLTGSLVATAAADAPNQLGGTVEIGTSANFNSATGTYNTTGCGGSGCGYENVATSGAITIGANAVINVSGGTFDGLSGGTVLFRAPLLQDGSVNVSLPSAFAPNAGVIGARSATLEAYAVWSTADSTTGAQHFDGIIDPAGWYDQNGNLLSGTFKNASGTVVATTVNTVNSNGTSTTTLINDDGTTNNLAYYLSTDYFTPTTPNTAHETFYGFANGNSSVVAGNTTPTPGTLMGFVQNPGFQPIANSGSIGILQEMPGIELDNPASGGVNSGNISVLTNWNLGALSVDINNNATLAFRYNGIAPVLTIRAGGNLAIDASITDGFAQVGNTIYAVTPVPTTYDTYANTDTTYNNDLSTYGSTAIASLTYLIPVLSLNTDTAAASQNTDTAAILALQAPSTEFSTYADQYYKSWDTYLLRYTTFYNDLTNASNNPYYSATGLTPATTLTSTSPSVTSTMKTDATNLNSALTTLQNDASFTTLTAYTTYLTAYSTYATRYLTWANAVRNLGIQTLIQPPLPPPLVSNPFIPPIPPIPSLAQANSPDVMATAGNEAAIAGMDLAAEASSSSYRFVAGADVASADPLALDDTTEGNVTLGQHTLAQVITGDAYYIAMPTTVRTGTGSIDIAASGDFKLLDTLAPGVIYTAGTIPTASSEGTSLAIGPGGFTPTSGDVYGVSTIVTSGTNPSGGGNITLAVRGDIIGIEETTDTLATSVTTPNGLTSFYNGSTAQFWVPWLLKDAKNSSIAWYVNFGSFDQGIMSIGGNVTISAGGDIHDLAVSLPTTGYLDASDTLHVTGGGNLSVIAGGSIYSGDFYVGLGTGTIRSGGAIASDLTYSEVNIDPENTSDLGTLLAVQYGTIDVSARTNVDIGGVYDPTYLFGPGIASPVRSCTSSAACVSLVPYFTSMSTQSGVFVQTTSGNLAFNTLLDQADLFGLGQVYPVASGGNEEVTSLLLPASLGLVALGGSITVDHGGGLYPSVTGTLTLLADTSITLEVEPYISYTGTTATPSFDLEGNVFPDSFGKLDYPVGTGILPTASNPTLTPVGTLNDIVIHDPTLVTSSVTDPVMIVALDGNLADGALLPTGATGGQMALIPNAPTLIYAGGNISDLLFHGENFTSSDITAIIAGGNIDYNLLGSQAASTIELAGPGTLIVQAGGNLDFKSQFLSGVGETGIRTIGNSIDKTSDPLPTSSPTTTSSTLDHFGNPWLPVAGASVDVLFGVGKGMNTAAFIADYINPATAGAFALSPDVWSYLDATNNYGSMTPEQFWAMFQAQSQLHQQLLIEQVFFAVLNATGIDENDPSSAYYHSYANGYEAINALFPASYGYTQNSLSGGTNGGVAVDTGDLDLRGSTIQTQRGGNISIVGPGGRMLVGSPGAAPTNDPSIAGIITMEKGNIDIFADRDVLVAQSRIMTEEGGDILMWSSNGNLDAGEGRKTSVTLPPPVFSCDTTWMCRVNAQGEVSGAGIATLQSLPDAPTGDANLIAPRGTVNAGAAGIRVSGNLNVAAFRVANTFNIQVQGTTTGIPMAAVPNIGALTAASNTSGASMAAAAEAAKEGRNRPMPQDLPSIITVEVIGYGGGGTPADTQNGAPRPDERRKKPDRQSLRQDPDSAVQVLGAGILNEQARQYLTPDERSRLQNR